MAYDPNKLYTFVAEDGSRFTSKGDNGYVQQAVESGLPITINSAGEWYVTPYLEKRDGKVVANVPKWFKDTKEYTAWQSYASQMSNTTWTDENFSNAADILSQLGSQGYVRKAYTEQATNYGITDPTMQKRFAQNSVNYLSGKGDINLSGQDYSVNDALDMVVAMDKSSRADLLANAVSAMTTGKVGETQLSQEAITDLATWYNLLNYVADNPNNYDEKYQGILDADFLQQLNVGVNTAFGVAAEGIFGLIARPVWAIANLITRGKEWDFRVEEMREAAIGNDYYLRGIEAPQAIGTVAGVAANMAMTMVMSQNLLGAQGGIFAKVASGSLYTAVQGFSATLVGGAVTDLFLNDIPQDIFYFISDIADYTGQGDSFGEAAKKAWYNGETAVDSEGNVKYTNGQKLFGLFGPEVAGGMAMNLVGDVLMDAAVAVIPYAFGALPQAIDQATGGAYTRFKENVAIKNLEVQDVIGNTPVLGPIARKLVDHMMGAENANFIRLARKASIASGDMTFYKQAHNLLTLANHAGMDVVSPKLAKIKGWSEYQEKIKYFVKNAEKYGGVGETKIAWEKIAAGGKKVLWDMVPDILPRQVKKALLDMDRLSELKGEAQALGDIAPDPVRNAEIARIEARLAEVPDEVKEFGKLVSDINKRVEAMMVDLGLSTQDWIDKLSKDARFEDYMTRQTLTPNGHLNAGSSDPRNSKIVTGRRKGYSEGAYLDPVQSLAIKVRAIGLAYSWNERAKVVVAFEKSLGVIRAGGEGVNAAEELAKVTKKIDAIFKLRKDLGYDSIAGSITHEMKTISDSFSKMNKLLNLPDTINIKTVYTAGVNPEIKGFVRRANSGEIKMSEETVSAAGLSMEDAGKVINNSYEINQATDLNGVTNGTGRGMAANGRPYSFEIKNNEIVNLKQLTDYESLADSTAKIAGVYNISTQQIEAIGKQNLYAVNRALLFYRDNIPSLAEKTVFRTDFSENSYGYIHKIPQAPAKINEDGTLSLDYFDIYLCSPYRSECEERLQRYLDNDVSTHFHPYNSNDASNTPIHENGHSVMQRLALADMNRKIINGELPKFEYIGGAKYEFYLYRVEYEKSVIKDAMEKIGDPGEWGDTRWMSRINKQRDLISGYAARNSELETRNTETIAESIVDYAFNGASAAPLSKAIVEVIQERLEKFTDTVDVRAVWEENGLDVNVKMFNEDGGFSFTGCKNDLDRAKWLDKWRQQNPYIKKTKATEVDYQKANAYDSFLSQQILKYSADYNTKSPDALVNFNDKFIKNLKKNIISGFMDELKKHSVDDFDVSLATMLFSTNKADISDALETFVLRKIDSYAQSLAERMSGGLSPENLDSAKATLFSDPNVRNAMINLVSELSPNSTIGEVTEAVTNLLETNAKGIAASMLEIDPNDYLARKEELERKIKASNRRAKKTGKHLDQNYYKVHLVDGEPSHIIHYKERGNDVYVVVDDPVVSTVLKRPYAYHEHGQTTEAILRQSQYLARFYKLGTTNANPVSWVRNVLRDPFQAVIQGGFNPATMNLDPQMFYRTLRTYGLEDDVINEVTEQLKEWAKGGTLTSEMKRQTASGWKHSRDIQDKVLNSKGVQLLEAPLDAWESFFRNQIGQQSFIKNFQKTGDVNKAMASAMFDSSNSTTNFSHAVGKFQNATSTVPYLSSAVNGWASFWRQYNADPVGMITRISAGFMVPVFAITAYNLSTEEQREAYMNLPMWYRESHLVLVAPGGGVLSLPVPEEISQYFNLARNAMEYTQNASPYAIPTIMAQGAFGFLPVDVNGFFGDDGQINMQQGFGQMMSGIMPQAATLVYEWVTEQKLFGGQDISYYSFWDKIVNASANVFGTGFRQVINDIGLLFGAGDSDILGLSTADQIARDLFGIGFNGAKQQFMTLIGSKASVDPETGKEHAATGLFAENEKVQKQVEALTQQIAYADDDEKEELEAKRQKLIDDYGDKVAKIMNKYMTMYTSTGGLEDWQRKKLIQLLMLGVSTSSADDDSWEAGEASDAYYAERQLAIQRYVDKGLPSGATPESLAENDSGNLVNSIAAQAAINKWYGTSKQAVQDVSTAIKNSGLKTLRNKFYEAVQEVYDIADRDNTKPDYDLIEKIQARYLQSVDQVLVPIINQYGMSILNNNDFVNEVRTAVSGMIPSNDWKQSERNAKKYLSSKDFPTATVDVKEWLIKRYSTAMTDRGLESDQWVTNKIQEIKNDLDNGKTASAKSKVELVLSEIGQSHYYISEKDLLTLQKYRSKIQ